MKCRSMASSSMDPEIKHTSRQYEHVVPAAQVKRTRRRGVIVQIEGRRLCLILYAEMPCSLSKLDLGLCWFDDRLNTVLPRLFNLFEFSPSVS